MVERLRDELFRILRVPPEPEPPDGSPESIRIFRAGDNFYRLLLLRWALMHLPVLLGVLALTAVPYLPKFARYPAWLQTGFHVAIGLAWLSYIAALVISYLQLKLDFDMRWYIVTDRSLRIRSGILSLQELTMTFANIQDIRVSSGPLEGFFKLADLEVRSAGGGVAVGPHKTSAHAAYFEGVDNAEEIRELILRRLRTYRDAGLGDAGHMDTVDAEAAARILLQEARALRTVLAP